MEWGNASQSQAMTKPERERVAPRFDLGAILRFNERRRPHD
jgi:hypothetical protein